MKDILTVADPGGQPPPPPPWQKKKGNKKRVKKGKYFVCVLKKATTKS